MTTTTSVESVLLNNPNLASHPKLESLIQYYSDALQGGYEPDPDLIAEMVTVLAALEIEDPVLQETIDVFEQELNESLYDDFFTGTELGDSFSGLEGNSYMLGFGGNDVLIGDPFLIDNAVITIVESFVGGNDYIDFGSGNDVGSGDGIYVNIDGNELVRGGNDTLLNSEYVVGDFFDLQVGNGGIVIGGDDLLTGGDGATLHGDFRWVEVSTGAEIRGGNDTITGSDSGDMIYGDWDSAYQVDEYNNAGPVIDATLVGGDDVITGGGGNDILYGDGNVPNGSAPESFVGGADTFIFATGSGLDTIRDFETGKDIIDVSGYGIAQGDYAAFEIASIQVTAGNTVIDFDGTAADIDEVTLVGVTDLTADDFTFFV